MRRSMRTAFTAFTVTILVAISAAAAALLPDHAAEATDLGVMDVTGAGLKLVELAPGVTEDELREKTGVPVS